jgi:hypothetical protein
MTWRITTFVGKNEEAHVFMGGGEPFWVSILPRYVSTQF